MSRRAGSSRLRPSTIPRGRCPGSWLSFAGPVDIGRVADLLVTQTVSGALEFPQIENARLFASRAAADVHAIAGPEGGGGYADLGQLEAVVHLGVPGLAAIHSDHQHGMRMDETEFFHHAIQGHAAAVVVDARK